MQGATAKLLPLLEKIKGAYILWYNYRDTFPKKFRYTLGDKIDRLFLDILELLNLATYQKVEDKLLMLSKTTLKLDALKFFLRISWEVKLLDNQKYITHSEHLQELGRMIGGRKKGLETKVAH